MTNIPPRKTRTRAPLPLLFFAAVVLAVAFLAGLSMCQPEAEPFPEGAWTQILVNRENPLPEGYRVTLRELGNGQAVDERIWPAFHAMLAGAERDGIWIKVNSSFRTEDQQRAILEDKIDQFREQGLSEEEARRQAEAQAQLPGTSEHQTGLALDLTTANAALCSAEQVWQWLAQNAADYGFILRYPQDKQDLTGIEYEPWHYRYVGKKTAEALRRTGRCLEEYIAAPD